VYMSIKMNNGDGVIMRNFIQFLFAFLRVNMKLVK
jgi:hypothetical protein